MDDLFQGMLGRRHRRHRLLGLPAADWFGPIAPSSDVFVRDGDLVMRVELPGIERRLPLPEGTSEDAIEATAEKGVLQVTVHGAAKAIEEPAKPERKAIPIRATE